MSADSSLQNFVLGRSSGFAIRDPLAAGNLAGDMTTQRKAHLGLGRHTAKEMPLRRLQVARIKLR
jgi:hypothetical protein